MLGNKGFIEQVRESGSVAHFHGLNVEELRLMVDRMKKLRLFVEHHPVMMFLSKRDYYSLCADMDSADEFDEEHFVGTRISTKVGKVLILFHVFESEQDYALLVPVTTEYPDPSKSLLIEKI